MFVLIFQSLFFRMSETLDCYILLHLLISIIFLLSVFCQLLVPRMPSWHRVCKILVLTFSIINSTINQISFGLSDHYSLQHIIVLSLLLCTRSLQIVLLGITTQRKVTIRYSVHEHIVWDSISVLEYFLWSEFFYFCEYISLI